MAKILKNNTANIVPISDVGAVVPASSNYTIQPYDYLLFTNSSDVIIQVSNGTLTVNDGSVDLSITDGIDLIKGIFQKNRIIGNTDATLIGNVTDRLKVIDNDVVSAITDLASTLNDNDDVKIKGILDKTSSTSNAITYTEEGDRRRLDVLAKITGNIPVTAAVMCYSSKLKYEPNSTTTALTDSFANQYTYSGTGKLVGFAMTFDHKDTEVKLLVDGDTVFSVASSDVEYNAAKYSTMGLDWEPNKKTISFYPNFPICFDTSVTIQAKQTSSGRSRLYYLVAIEKIT